MDSSKCKTFRVHDLPYKTKKALSDILDMNDQWKDLGGVCLKLSRAELDRMGKAVLRRESPTNELLDKMGSLNCTVKELFLWLNGMNHFLAMDIIKSYVEPKYHRLIPDGTSIAEPSIGGDGVIVRNGAGKSGTRQLVIPQDLSKHGNEITTKRKLSEGSEAEKLECIPFIDYEELTRSTNNWDISRKLGQGGFGVVFKGLWRRTEVAIKRLELHKKNEESATPGMQMTQSLKELKNLNISRHDNVLPLYGYSIHENKYVLVYQYMPKGSLEQCLHRSGSDLLPWRARYNIAKGIARGLQFLHGMDPPLIHADIKSANILLDNHFEPKIGDFGLARYGPSSNRTHLDVSRVYGTRPYLPFEFHARKKFSTKVDTYSFGVVLFEIATGLRPYAEDRAEKYLRDYVCEYEEKLLANLYPRGLTEFHLFAPLFKFFIDLGKKCCEFEAQKRPQMITVYEELDAVGIRNISDNTQTNRTNIRKLSDYIGTTNPFRKNSFVLHQMGNSVNPGLFDAHVLHGTHGSHLDYRSPSPTNSPSRNPSPLMQVPEVNSNDKVSSLHHEPPPNKPVVEQNMHMIPDIKLTPAIDSCSCSKKSESELASRAVSKNGFKSNLSSGSNIISNGILSEQYQIDYKNSSDSVKEEPNDVLPNISLLQDLMKSIENNHITGDQPHEVQASFLQGLMESQENNNVDNENEKELEVSAAIIHSGSDSNDSIVA